MAFLNGADINRIPRCHLIKLVAQYLVAMNEREAAVGKTETQWMTRNGMQTRPATADLAGMPLCHTIAKNVRLLNNAFVELIAYTYTGEAVNDVLGWDIAWFEPFRKSLDYDPNPVVADERQMPWKDPVDWPLSEYRIESVESPLHGMIIESDAGEWNTQRYSQILCDWSASQWAGFFAEMMKPMVAVTPTFSRTKRRTRYLYYEGPSAVVDITNAIIQAAWDEALGEGPTTDSDPFVSRLYWREVENVDGPSHQRYYLGVEIGERVTATVNDSTIAGLPIEAIVYVWRDFLDNGYNAAHWPWVKQESPFAITDSQVDPDLYFADTPTAEQAEDSNQPPIRVRFTIEEALPFDASFYQDVPATSPGVDNDDIPVGAPPDESLRQWAISRRTPNPLIPADGAWTEGGRRKAAVIVKELRVDEELTYG